MSENKNQAGIITTGSLKDNAFSLKDFLYNYLRYWPLILICIISFLAFAFLYLRYIDPLYNVTAKILIKDDTGPTSGAASQDILSDIDILNTKNNVNNEMQILETRFLISKVVDSLDLNVSYFIVGRIKSSELYKTCPFKANIISQENTVAPLKFDLKFSKDGRSFNLKNKNVDTSYNLFDTVKLSTIKFIIEPIKSDKKLQNGSFSVVINSLDATTDKYLKDINLEIPDKEANVILLTLQQNISEKGEDILNTLYSVYTQINQQDKNITADSTINFIDSRLAIVSDELSGVEKNIEQFKTQNQLYTNLQEQGSLALNNVSDLQKQLVQQQVQINVLESIENHIKNNTARIVPNAADIQDPTYISAVEKYNDLVLERDRQLQTSKPDNPLIKNLNSQIESMRIDLLTDLANIKAGMITAQNELEKKNAQIMGQIKTTPSKEHAFLDISRQQDVKQQLYLYLLQKREETAITKSGTEANSRLIEPAKSDQLPFFPNKQLVYVIALALGIIVSGVIIYFRELLNNKINTKKDILKVVDVPIIGEIGHNDTNETIVTKQNSRTPLSEQFRIIRTNLQFILKGKKQAILVTSSMSEEGKSFISMNLACSLAIAGKRVLLLELDLRRPKISKSFGLSAENGFSDYVVGALSKEELVKATLIHPNLFLISAGTIPPNPAELLLEESVADLFKYLKTKWDYIIVDTPPVGLVTDAVIIGNYIDVSLYVVRQGTTLKQQLTIINDLSINAKIPDISILVNDVQFKARYGYGYAYGYGYGYGYGYSSNASSSRIGKGGRFSFLKGKNK